MGNEATQFKSGNPGKQKGSEMKATKVAKEIILSAIDEMAPDFKGVMNELRETDKRTYVQIMVKLFDFVLPKKLEIDTGVVYNVELTKGEALQIKKELEGEI